MSAPQIITATSASAMLSKMRPPMERFGCAIRTTVKNALPAMRKLGQALADLRDEAAWQGGRTSAERYALTGHCYGRNARGKKRWLLEQSQRRRR